MANYSLTLFSFCTEVKEILLDNYLRCLVKFFISMNCIPLVINSKNSLKGVYVLKTVCSISWLSKLPF